MLQLCTLFIAVPRQIRPEERRVQRTERGLGTGQCRLHRNITSSSKRVVLLRQNTNAPVKWYYFRCHWLQLLIQCHTFCFNSIIRFLENTSHRTNVGSMLGQMAQHWTNIGSMAHGYLSCRGPARGQIPIYHSHKRPWFTACTIHRADSHKLSIITWSFFITIRARPYALRSAIDKWTWRVSEQTQGGGGGGGELKTSVL